MKGRKEQDERLAALGDLRQFLRLSERRGELEIVRGADPNLEIGALCELSLEATYPPVLLFEEIKGADPKFRIVVNVRSSPILVGPLDLAAVEALRKSRKGEAPRRPIPPRPVDTGPVMENVKTGAALDLGAFPAPLWHAGDGGPYIGTECLVITRDPGTDWVNVGTYRVQVQGPRALTVFIDSGKHGAIIRQKYWDRDEACPMVVCVGQAPVLGATARGAAPVGVDEFAVAGAALGRAIDVVPGPITGLPIPADAELVFEGHVPPVAEGSFEEGPFGEWTGYYGATPRPEPVFRVEAAYHRDDAIIVGQPPALPTFPGRQTHLAGAAAIWDAIEAAGVPGVKGVWKMQGGGSRFINVVAIEQLFAGHAKMAGMVATACGPGAYMGRLTIVVDDDIDITNTAEVMWAMATRWDPKTQTDILDGYWTGHIDPTLTPEKRAAGDITNSRMVIYAVRPYHWKERFPKVNRVDRDTAEKVRAKWADKLNFLKR
ncbi:MAG: UbiD family decarboxylase [Proteobacteria bacterium]|nr:UbiD family decarboxylase [Pseudomonadota bacterium]